MKPQVVMRHSSYAHLAVEFRFAHQVAGVACKDCNPMAVLHETTIINCYGDAVLRAVKVIYSVDTAGVKVCPSAQLAGCQTPGVVIELPVPSIPATYWRSQEKTVKVRVCPDPHLLDDNYSLQYQIRFESESRGGNGLHTELFESTMLIKGV